MGVDVVDWGLTGYEEAFERQKEMVQARIDGEIADTLVFTEHRPVYTIGKRIGAGAHLLWDEGKLREQGIEVVETNRGGDITYHGPGQIVGYGIVNIERTRDLHRYLRDLEQVIINGLGCHGIAGSRRKEMTGIWLKTQKIAAIGVAVRRWVTYHGFALNVDPDLSHFEGIVPCGISSAEGTVTSMAKVLGDDLGKRLDVEAIKSTLAGEFKNIFDT